MFALTPVATLMFRFNNPDAMLTLLVVASGYTLVGRWRGEPGWLAATGALIGLAFITKLGQALLIVPALALVYLITAPGRPLRRIGQLLVPGLTLIVGAGWWIALVELWPASARPYIGGSTSNSVLELALGFNGLGRLLGSDAGDPAATGINAMAPMISGSTPGMTRLFTDELATEISWLLPTALLCLVAGLWLTRRVPRTHLGRAAILLFGLWLMVTATVFSTMEGIFHEYYTIALAPPIAGMVATCGLLLWRERSSASTKVLAAAVVLLTAGWDIHLLASNASYLPWLRYAVGAAAVLGVVFGVAAAVGRPLVRSARRPIVAAALVAATASGLAGAGAYAVVTVSREHTGSIPRSGLAKAGFKPLGADLPNGTMRSLNGTMRSLNGTMRSPNDTMQMPFAEGVDPQLVSMLRATTTTWAAATIGAMVQAPLQLASGRPVISVGGFTGDDPAPSLDTFTRSVSRGEIHYFMPTGGGFSAMFGASPGNGTGSQIENWVKTHYTSLTVGQYVVYDLTRPTKSLR
jgi:4-amino-4-deoxy-L-arabinose transferase-like glycosyltransferase